jgi:flagellar hook-basal body complex protein FliE
MSEMISMIRTDPKHMGPIDSPYAGSGKKMLALRDEVGAKGGMGTFEDAMLQALDKVSGKHQYASALQQEAIVNPDAVDVHDITIAQAEANMSLGITRNILSRLVQGWRDLINIR